MRYDAFIERDLAAIPGEVAAFRAEHSAEETWTGVTRFAVLAFSPSQHSRHALLACLSAWDLREELGGRFDEAIVECAIYAAASRQPWSEPPMLDPPPLDPGQRGDLDELRGAIASADRLRGERWLAARFRDAGLAADYFAAASDDFPDLGHKLIVANASWRLAALLGEKGSYAMLRVGVWEMIALKREQAEDPIPETPLRLDSLCAALVGNIIADDGGIVSAHALFLFDAALQTGHDAVIDRVARHLSSIDSLPLEPPPSTPLSPPALSTLTPYRFGRDYGACFKAHAVAGRLQRRFPDVPFDAMLAAVHRNLAAAPSSEEMTFA